MLIHLIIQLFTAGLPQKAGSITDASSRWLVNEFSMTISATLIVVCVIGYLFETVRCSQKK